MNHKFFLLLVFVLPTGLVGQKIGEVERRAPSLAAAREVTLEWTSDAERPYWYRLPKDIDSKRPPALIFLLHGTGMNHGWGFWNYGVAGGSFRPKDIVVSPEGVTDGAGGTFNFVQGKKDGDQILNLIQTFKKAFPIGNVYLYGHSQGAFFTYWFAGAHPEHIHGIVAHAGNVIGAELPKLAAERVAVAILHAESDQVVGVECAYRSEKLYREAGYKKLKLEVLKGIRPEAGHWPMPEAVLKLLDWCDQVSVSTADSALLVAEAELRKPQLDLGVIKEALERAETLRKSTKPAERDAIDKRLEVVRMFHAALAPAAVDHVRAVEGVENPKSGYGTWGYSLRAFPLIPGSEALLKKSAPKVHARVERDSRQVRDARKKLERDGARGFRDAFKVYSDAVAAVELLELERALGALEQDVREGKVASEWSTFLELRKSREAADEAAVGPWRKLVQDVRDRTIGTGSPPQDPGK
jgi:predicted esterase